MQRDALPHQLLQNGGGIGLGFVLQHECGLETLCVAQCDQAALLCQFLQKCRLLSGNLRHKFGFADGPCLRMAVQCDLCGNAVAGFAGFLGNLHCRLHALLQRICQNRFGHRVFRVLFQ